MNPNEKPVANLDPNFQQSEPQNAQTQRAIHRAYGQRTSEVLTHNPSHQPHECCARIFPDKEAFNAHFQSVHVPYILDDDGKQIDNPSYVAPEQANAEGTHRGLPLAEHRVGGVEVAGFSTGLKATEKHIPVPSSGNPLTGAEQVEAAAATDSDVTTDNLSEMSKADRKQELGGMKKAELLDVAAQHGVEVSGSENKAELTSAINKKMNKEDKDSAA